MRLITYVGLVLRRIWARKIMLLGSFLGATLVTALLVILPLYEASVQAIDLLFTFRQAPASSVDISAVHTSNRFTPAQAASNREAIDVAAAPLRRWYPETRERIVALEFALIPLDSPDWMGRAAEWREAGGHASGEPAPYPTVPPEPLQTRLFTSPEVESLVEMIDGGFVDDPHPFNVDDPVLRVVFGEALARRAGLQVGDRIAIRGFISTPSEFEVVEVSGIARVVEPTDVMWDQVLPAAGVHFLSATADNLIFVQESTLAAWTGVISEEGAWEGAFEARDPSTDPWSRTQRGFRATAHHSFFMTLDRDAVTLETVEDLTRNIVGLTSNLARSDIRSLSALPRIVAEFDVRTVVFGAPILAMLALVVAGALYFLIYMAALAIEREGSELALLRMRGASPWQTTGLHLIQSAVIAAGAMALAPFVARLMVSVTGFIPPMSSLTGGEALGIAAGRSIVPFIVAGGALTFASMGLAILPVARRGVLELRALSTRPSRTSVWQRYHLDLFLIVLAAVILWELSQRGIVDTGQDQLGLDPFSIAAPALFLFSGALLLLRVLPWILRSVGWLMTKTRGMVMALPGWHLGRNPIPYGRLALLVWLTTGFGAFALTYAETLETSYADRAAFTSGADARVIGPGVAYLDPPEGAVASPVYRGLGGPQGSTRGAELLAIDPETFPAVTAWREDFGATTPQEAFGPDVFGEPVRWGIDLPSGITAIEVDGVVMPRPWADQVVDGSRDPVRLMVRLVDDRGRFRIHPASDPFVDTAWRTVSVDLDGEAALNGPFGPSASLAVQAVWLERDGLAGNPLEAGEVIVADWRVVAPSGDVDLGAAIDGLDTFSGLSRTTAPAGAAADEYFSEVPEGVVVTDDLIARSPLVRDGEATLWSFPTRNRAQAVPHVRAEPQPITVVIDREVARTAGLGIGDETVFGFGGVQAPGVVAGIVDLVPTTGDARYSGVMLMRLDALVHWASPDPRWSLGATIARTAEANELWIRTDTVDDTLRAVLAAYGEEPEDVITAAAAAADFSSRPIQVGLIAILFIGTGAGVVLALAGVTGYVLVAVRRRYREMGVLRALGFRRRGVAGTFALEQLVVLGLGAIVGVGAGIGLMRLMIPFLQLGEGATELVPAATMEIAAGRLGIYLAVVAGLLVLSVLASTRSVSARRLSEVLREVER